MHVYLYACMYVCICWLCLFVGAEYVLDPMPFSCSVTFLYYSKKLVYTGHKRETPGVMGML